MSSLAWLLVVLWPVLFPGSAGRVISSPLMVTRLMGLILSMKPGASFASGAALGVAAAVALAIAAMYQV